MSIKRVVLMVAVLILTLPAAALADGVDLGFSGGVADVTGAIITNASGLGVLSSWDFVRRTPAPPGFNMVPGIGNSFGTVAVTSGVAFNAVGNTVFLAPGGNITFTSNAFFQAFTGGAVTAGTIVFSGAFNAVQTFTMGLTNTCPTSLTTSLNISPSTLCTAFRLTGTVVGTLDASFLGFLGLNGNQNSAGTGWLSTLDFFVPTFSTTSMQIAVGDASLVVPEPGTLALFGTGLISIAGLLRRKLAA